MKFRFIDATVLLYLRISWSLSWLLTSIICAKDPQLGSSKSLREVPRRHSCPPECFLPVKVQRGWKDTQVLLEGSELLVLEIRNGYCYYQDWWKHHNVQVAHLVSPVKFIYELRMKALRYGWVYEMTILKGSSKKSFITLARPERKCNGQVIIIWNLLLVTRPLLENWPRNEQRRDKNIPLSEIRDTETIING